MLKISPGDLACTEETMEISVNAEFLHDAQHPHQYGGDYFDLEPNGGEVTVFMALAVLDDDVGFDIYLLVPEGIGWTWFSNAKESRFAYFELLESI